MMSRIQAGGDPFRPSVAGVRTVSGTVKGVRLSKPARPSAFLSPSRIARRLWWFYAGAAIIRRCDWGNGIRTEVVSRGLMFKVYRGEGVALLAFDLDPAQATVNFVGFSVEVQCLVTTQKG